MKNEGERFSKIARVLIGLVLLCILYLFALNGRYLNSGKYIVDKWKGQAYSIGSSEMPIIVNKRNIYKKRNDDEISRSN